MNDFTLVVGVDYKHLRQLSLTYPTWKKHKPSLTARNMVVFYDVQEVKESQIQKILGDKENVHYFPWPPADVNYEKVSDDRFGEPQRYKMLAGFVHVPPLTVNTPYWMKLDTDVVATGNDDWIDPTWFKSKPAIISHPWGFTKPADQVDFLDAWVETHKQRLPVLAKMPPLELHPEPGWERLRHKRIISWCSLFATHITRLASDWAKETCGTGKLPVPSQDGYMWYVAKRMDYSIECHSMKKRGWEQWHSFQNIDKAVKRSLETKNTSSLFEVTDA